MLDITTHTMSKIILQNNNQQNTCNNIFASHAPTHIPCNESGFFLRENNVIKNHINIKITTIQHQIANFLKERFILDHFLTSAGFFICT
jgi:hypothetical protein